MGPYPGGQAQYVRVPFADFNCLKLPAGKEFEEDFILLADIFPTGWHGVDLSGFQPGDSIAVWGAGRKSSAVLCDLELMPFSAFAQPSVLWVNLQFHCLEWTANTSG